MLQSGPPACQAGALTIKLFAPLKWGALGRFWRATRCLFPVSRNAIYPTTHTHTRNLEYHHWIHFSDDPTIVQAQQTVD